MSSIMNMLKSALQHEVKASVLYNRAVDMTDNEEAKSLFIELSGFEDDHAKKIIQSATGYRDTDPEALQLYLDELEKTANESLNIKETDVLKHGDMKQILELAIGFEESARDAYIHLTENTDEGELKKFCERMAEEEHAHAKLLDQALINLDIDPEERAGL